MEVLRLLLECVQNEVVLQLEHQLGDPILVVPPLGCQLVDCAVKVDLQVLCGVDLGDNAENLLLNLLSLSSLLQLLYGIS